MRKKVNDSFSDRLRIMITGKSYRSGIVTFALISILLVLLDYAEIVPLSQTPYREIDALIAILFIADYVLHFSLARHKRDFVKQNLFDLVAIIPIDTVFTFFRLGRVLRATRLSKLSRLSRLIGHSGKLKYQLRRFMHTNGLIYVIYVNSLVVLFASIVFFIVEQQSFGESLWWVIVTTTTVGYGDTVPVSFIGKVIATILMFVGIGTVGMLTSTFTKFFIKEEEQNNLGALRQEIAEQKILIHQLLERLEKMD